MGGSKCASDVDGDPFKIRERSVQKWLIVCSTPISILNEQLRGIRPNEESILDQRIASTYRTVALYLSIGCLLKAICVGHAIWLGTISLADRRYCHFTKVTID